MNLIEEIKRLKKETIEDLKIKDNQNEIEIRFRIFEKERIFLEEKIKHFEKILGVE